MMGSSSPSHGGGGGEERQVKRSQWERRICFIYESLTLTSFLLHRNPLLASDGKDVEEGDDPAHFSDTKPLL